MSIKYKILILFTVTLLVATALNLLFMSDTLRDNYIEALKSELFAQASGLKSHLTRITDLGIAVKDIEGFDQMCIDLVKKNKSISDAMIIDSEGTILYHNNPMYHGKKIKSVEISQVLREKQPRMFSLSENNSNIYRVIVPYHVSNGYDRYGVVVSCPADIIDARIMTLITQCNIFFLCTFGLAALLLLLILRSILTKPLEIIADTMKTVSDSKNLGQHIEIQTDDEIGQIANAFNKMTEHLHHTTTSVERLNEEIKIRKQAENQAEAARQEAELANTMKSIFLANMSHEIRTPMNALMGFAEILSEERLASHQNNYVRVILDNAHALLNLINDILDFSKIETGRLHLETVACVPSELLNDIYSTLSPMAGAKGIEFKLIVSPNLPGTIYCDPARLRQCLMNLISNAIKYTQRGHVYVRALVNTSDEQRSTLYFVVEDTGSGIPKSKVDRIFDVFSQADYNDVGQTACIDLGLAITKRLVELMGGQIFVVSEQASGSVFTISLPLQTTVLSAPQPEPASA